MRRHRFLTPAEHRLTVLLLVLTLLGMIDRGVDELDPEVRAWLEADPVSPAPSAPSGGARSSGIDSLVASFDPGALPDTLGTGIPEERAASGARLVDPNSASESELDALPGIGPALAARIVAERGRGGPFGTPEDLLRVRGIGPATLARLRPFLDL